MKPINLVTIVDNDPIFAFIEKKILEETNLVNQIRIFNNGLKALDFIKLNAKKRELLPDIILLDLNMPVMNGWEFLDEYIGVKHTLEKKITIYVVAHSLTDTDKERINNINEVSNFIIKPMTKEKFEKIVKALKDKSNSLNKI
ncbi:MAG: response regulator [Bacteroidota bacterium]|nr:response regulator [Bacteroidota bacterium]